MLENDFIKAVEEAIGSERCARGSETLELYASDDNNTANRKPSIRITAGEWTSSNYEVNGNEIIISLDLRVARHAGFSVCNQPGHRLPYIAISSGTSADAWKHVVLVG